jgi:nitrate reductase molybdenum cofactor assembly chaperone NarJ/NarW
MIAQTTVFTALAEVLIYPERDFHYHVKTCRQALLKHPEALEHYELFVKSVAGLSVDDLEEIYTRTFDVNPLSTLDMGWHLYGETYQRGRFMVEMRAVLKKFGVEEGGELPDNLCYMLRALDRMEPEMRGPFTREIVLKALAKIIDGLKGKDNFFIFPLLALQSYAKCQVDECGAGGFNV